MGASWFEITAYGPDGSTAYKKLCNKAEEEYGQNGYNGTISTTDGWTDMTSKFRVSGKTPSEFINGCMDSMRKRDCAAICIQEPKANTNRTKSQVEHIVTPGTKKWVLKYVVRHGDYFIGSWDKKADAVKDARKYTESYQEPTTIEIEKVLDKGSSRVAIIRYKKSSTERPGKWVFFGYAAE